VVQTRSINLLDQATLVRVENWPNNDWPLIRQQNKIKNLEVLTKSQRGPGSFIPPSLGELFRAPATKMKSSTLVKY
jgi:hypothetical protein